MRLYQFRDEISKIRLSVRWGRRMRYFKKIKYTPSAWENCERTNYREKRKIDIIY